MQNNIEKDHIFKYEALQDSNIVIIQWFKPLNKASQLWKPAKLDKMNTKLKSRTNLKRTRKS